MRVRAKESKGTTESTQRFRDFSGWQRVLVLLLTVVWGGFQLYYAVAVIPDVMVLRPIHVTFGLSLTFLFIPPSRSSRESKLWLVVDTAFVLICMVIGLYLSFQWIETIQHRSGAPILMDLVLGCALTVLVIEAVRRTIGLALAILCTVFLAYIFLDIPVPIIMHPVISLRLAIDFLFLGSEGIYGIVIGVSATYLYLFVLFGQVLAASGAANVFLDLASALVGRYRGGAAKAAVIASGFFGNISGSAVANVSGTGAITIPWMKASGYSPRQAGAIEASASTFGQIMPPVMGAAAFIMASVLGVPFWSIAWGALLPAVLAYSAILMAVHIMAVRDGISPRPPSSIPKLREVLTKRGHLLLPPVVLIVLIMVFHWGVTRSILYTIGALVALTFVRSDTRLSIRKTISIFESTTKVFLPIVAICAGAGIIVGSTMLTGLAVRLSSALVTIGGENMLMLGLVAAVSSLILGMGIPSTPAYIIVSLLVAPALVRMGVTPLAAHMFVFYYAIVAVVTPPVASASFVAAALSGAGMWETSWLAFKLCMPLFLIPFSLLYSDALLLPGDFLQVLTEVFLILGGLTAMTAAAMKFLLYKLRGLEQLVLLLAGIAAMFPALGYWRAIGAVVLLLIAILNLRRRRTVYPREVQP